MLTNAVTQLLLLIPLVNDGLAKRESGRRSALQVFFYLKGHHNHQQVIELLMGFKGHVSDLPLQH